MFVSIYADAPLQIFTFDRNYYDAMNTGQDIHFYSMLRGNNVWEVNQILQYIEDNGNKYLRVYLRGDASLANKNAAIVFAR